MNPDNDASIFLHIYLLISCTNFSQTFRIWKAFLIGGRGLKLSFSGNKIFDTQNLCLFKE